MLTTLSLIAVDGGKEAMYLASPLLANCRFNRRIRRTNRGNITLRVQIRPMLRAMLMSMVNSEVDSLEVDSVMCSR